MKIYNNMNLITTDTIIINNIMFIKYKKAKYALKYQQIYVE